MIYAEALLTAGILAWLAQLAIQVRPWSLLLLVALLLFLAGFCAARAVGVDGDSPLYEQIFETCRLANAASIDICQLEPGFYVVAAVARVLGGMGWLQFLMALAALLPKLVVWQRLRCLAVAVPMYFALWYPLHEMTQMRAAVATGLSLVACLVLVETQRWRLALPWFIGAVLFHTSALAVFPALWIFERRPGLVVRAGAMVALAAALWVAGPVLSAVLQGPLGNVRHLSYLDEEVSRTLTGAGLLYQVLFYVTARVMVAKAQFADARDARISFAGLALLEMSLVAFFMFSSIPAFQLRFTQLLFSLGLIAVALPLSRTGWPVLAWTTGVVIALPFYFYNFDSGLILGPYRTFF